jgi:chemotaxis protein CheD
MYKIYNNKIKSYTITILPGEYYASNKNEIIYTILGSCISVVLYDPLLKIGGMNHFMLPEEGKKSDKDFFETQSGRYGINAMELLINSLLKLGTTKSRITAKIFGGSKVLNVINEKRISIADQNIDFAFKFMETENIPVVSSDTGGTNTRKILFYSGTGKVFQQKLKNRNYNEILANNLKKLNSLDTGEFTPFK